MWIKRFAYLHCIVHSIVQGNTTLAKSQSLEIKTVSWCTEICSIRSMSFNGKLADFRIQHGSYKVFSTVPQRSQKYTTPFI